MKCTITAKQAAQFNAMLYTLKKIAKEYQTTKQLRREAKDDYTLEYEEVLEMAYENIQHDAAFRIRGIRKILIKKMKNPNPKIDLTVPPKKEMVWISALDTDSFNYSTKQETKSDAEAHQIKWFETEQEAQDNCNILNSL